MKEPSEEFTIALRAIPDKVPAIIRLRRVLKIALRQYRLRCVQISPIEPVYKRPFHRPKIAFFKPQRTVSYE